MNEKDQYILQFWYVLLSITAWSAIYYVILSRNRAQSVMWNCRLVALIHSLLATRITEMGFLFGENPFVNIGEKNTKWQKFAMISSGGYFIFDFIWCCVMGTEGIMMLLHHVISILSLIGGLYLNQSGAEICITLWGSELTNPFLQARWFLKEKRLYDTLFAMLNDFTFFSIFAFVRVGIGSGLAYLFYQSKKTIMPIKICGFLFHGISLLWMWQISKFVKYRYFTKRLEKSKSETRND